MKILAIDSATAAASVAVIDDGKLLGESYTDYKLKHSEKLLLLADHLLKDLRISLEDIDLFAADKGPGSFTGLRIGASSVKAFAHAMNKKIIGVSSLHACAYMQIGFKGIVCPVFDAQRGCVYGAIFESSGDSVTRLEEDAAAPLEEMIEKLSVYESVMFCGDALFKYKDQIAGRLEGRARFANPLKLLPRASAVGMIAYENTDSMKHMPYTEFLPEYIRKAQAEANYSVKLP